MAKDKVEESIEIRGVCAAIQKMAMPSLQNLIDLLAKVGYKVQEVK